MTTSNDALWPKGTLVLVGTPIGNLSDLTPRARDALSRADLILCEDTRRTRALLSALSLKAGGRLLALHEHNEQARGERIVRALSETQKVVLVTDAGMPGISDPGERTVKEVVEKGFLVTVIPGPSALTAAVALSGLSAERFVFEGFVPRKQGQRRAHLLGLADEPRTTVFFESPRRLGALCGELLAAWGNRECTVGRELTKLHEQVWRGTLEEAARQFEEGVLGEVVLVVAGAEKKDVDDAVILHALEVELGSGTSLSRASASVAENLSVAKRRVYELGLAKST